MRGRCKIFEFYTPFTLSERTYEHIFDALFNNNFINLIFTYVTYVRAEKCSSKIYASKNNFKKTKLYRTSNFKSVLHIILFSLRDTKWYFCSITHILYTCLYRCIYVSISIHTVETVRSHPHSISIVLEEICMMCDFLGGNIAV